jgi:hypothetical protein
MLKSFTEIRQIRRAAVRAELIGSEGFTARANSPVLALCRLLIAAGIDPDRPLNAYRDDMLALRVRTIGEAADLEINSKGTGFVRCRQAVRRGPPIAQNLVAAE